MVGPTFTVRLGPSVRNTALAGTCSERPSELAAYAPAGCRRVRSRPASARHRLGGRREKSEHRMLFREIVHSTSKATDNPLPGKPVEGNVNRLAAADVEKISRNEDRATPAAVNCRKDP